MSWIDDIRSDFARLDKSTAKIASFGYFVAIILFILAVLILFVGKVPERSVPFFLLSAIIGFLSYFIPSFLKPIYSAWMILSLILGWIMSRLLLSILFFLLFTPISLLMKLFRRDILHQRIEKEASSYWISKAEVEKDYQKQF